MRRAVHWAIVASSFLWLTFVYASFYLVQQQRPLTGTHVAGIVGTLTSLFTTGAIVALAAGLGGRLSRWLGVAFATGEERLILSAGLGLGMISLIMLIVGVVGWLARWQVMLVLGVLGLLALPDLLELCRATEVKPRLAQVPRGLGLYLGGVLVLSLLVALAPPTDWDGLLYHLTMPKLYLQAGRITPMTDMHPQYSPGLMEMLYLLAMLLRGDIAAKLLHFTYMLLLGGLLYLLTERHARQGLGWYAVAAYASMPMVPLLASWAYNDLALAFYIVAAFYALFNWFGRRTKTLGSTSWLVLSGVFCGLAMGLKYTSFVLPLMLTGVIVWRLLRARETLQVILRALSVLGAVTLLVALPWYLRNWAFTGNPVYPFAYTLFGGVDWDLWRTEWYVRAGSGLGWDWGGLIKLPWTLTLGVLDINFHDGRMGPLFLLALPFFLAWSLGLFGRQRPRPGAVGYLLLFALIHYGFWTVGVVTSHSLFQSRLLFPAFVALCVPMAYVFDELRDLNMPALSLRRVIGMSVVLVLVANLAGQFLLTLRIRPLPVIVGEESQEDFLQRSLGAYYVAMQAVNQRVPESGRVLFLWEPRSYYCERSAQPDPILERWMWLLHRYDGDLSAIVTALGNEGYTYVLLHRSGLEFMRETRLDPIGDGDFAAWDRFAGRFLRLEATIGGAYELYQISDSPGQAS